MLTHIEVANFYLEIESVRANLGGGFIDTNELNVMKNQGAVDGPDGENWEEEIVNEHNRMLKNSVFKAVDKETIQPDTKLVDNTWVCKKNNYVATRGRLNTHGFK